MSEPKLSKPIRPHHRNSFAKWWLLVAVCLLAIAALLRLLYPVYRQRQIVATLRAKGLDVQVWPLFDDTWPEWMTTNLNEVLIQGAALYDDGGICTDDDVRLSVELFALTYDDVDGKPDCDLLLQRSLLITDAGLSHFRGSHNIRELELGSELITDAGFSHLAKLPLRSLTLSGTAVTSSRLVYLKDLTSLTSLTLIDSPVTNSGLAHLKGLTSLQKLDLYGTQVADAGLRHLASLRCLEELNLDYTQTTAAGLVHLLKLKRLRILELKGCELWDDSMPELTAFAGLETLDISESPITDKGGATIKRAMPKTRVSW